MTVQNALYLIPVPLGGPAALSVPPENAGIVRQIRSFIVESRREAVRFLVPLGVDVDSCTFSELNEHTPPEEDVSPMLEPTSRGEAVGVLSDAGCPAVGDPGSRAVECAHRRGIRVIPLVGPNSAVLALMASGLNGQNFAFNGYLPAKPAERSAAIRRLESRALGENQTQLFIEAPYRNAKLMESLLKTCRPETRLCVAAGLTTEREFVRTLPVSAWRKAAPPDIQKIPAIFMIGR